MNAAHVRNVIVRELPALAFVLMGTALWASLGDDIEFYDETLYLTNGVDLLTSGRPGFGWGPAYSDLYFLLSRIVHDPINLYVAGRAMSAVLFVLAVWFATRLHARATIAWAAAAVAALLPVTYVLPGVGGPAAGAALVGIALAFRWRGSVGIGLASAMLWLTAAARPEFVVLAIGCTAWAVAWLLWSLARRGEARRWATWVALAAALGTPLVLIGLHGSPLESGDRSWSAFIQHYPLHATNPGVAAGVDYTVIAERAFPGANSLGEAWSTNSGAVAHHFLANATSAPKLLLDQALTTAVMLDPILMLTQVGVLVFLVASALLLIAGRRRIGAPLPARVRGFLGDHAAAVAFTALLVVWALIPLVVVYPRPHYLPLLLGLLVSGIAIAVSRLARPRLAAWLLVVPITLVSAAFFAQVTVAYMARATQPPPRIIASLRQINAQPGGVDLLTGTDGQGLAVYAPSLRFVSEPTTGTESFGAYLDRTGTDAVNVTPALSAGPWGALPGFAEFMADPTSLGFEQLVPRSTIWVRSVGTA